MNWGLEDLERIVFSKPALFHYTRDDSLMKILSSQSLLARPTWDFADTEEYVLGLRLIKAQLEYVSTRHRERDEIPPSTRTLLDTYGVNSRILLEHTIQNIEYEIINYSNPRIAVYVACFTENPLSRKMVRAYGNNIISFNLLFPLVAYALPRPFVASMLSRVSYDRRHFSAYVMYMGFCIQESYGEEIGDSIKPLNSTDRIEVLSTAVSEFLCAFAPNIKHSSFSYEQEWRLKSVMSKHPKSILRNKVQPRLRKELGLPDDASFTNDIPKRYLQQLSIHGKMIADVIYGFGERGSELSKQVAEWRYLHSMPQVDYTFVKHFLSVLFGKK